MTVITKAVVEKKADKMEQLLIIEDEPAAVNNPKEEQQPTPKVCKGRYFALKLSVHRSASYLLFLIALLILIIGMCCGEYVYSQYARQEMHRFTTGWYSIPYDSTAKMTYTDELTQDGSTKKPFADEYGLRMESNMQEGSETDPGLSKSVSQMHDVVQDIWGRFFKERFEMDLQNNLYEEIEVPDFRGGRRGRFIHDFYNNKTAIIDIEGMCCFVMPLNRQRVLPPRSMYDLLRKMYNGDYDIDTKVVRETMKVVTPPITDMSIVGTYIARECQGLPTYLLRKVNPAVVKRSASSGVFGQFAGNSITEIDILNLDVVEAYTEHTPN